MEKSCSKCGVVKSVIEFGKYKQARDGLQRWCKACKSAHSKTPARMEKLRAYGSSAAGRATKDKYAKSLKGKLQHEVYMASGRYSQSTRKYARSLKGRRCRSARQKANRALKAGKLTSKPCEVCGCTERISMHHEDYSLPLDVVWLCKKHHTEADMRKQVRDGEK